MSSSAVDDSSLLFFWALVITRGAVETGGGGDGARAGTAHGMEGMFWVIWLPRVNVARSLGVSRAHVQNVAESAVGANVGASVPEGFARRATRARHAILLLLFRRRFLSLACLAGVSSATAGPLVEKITCSMPSRNSSTQRAHVPFTQHCR